MPVLVIPIEMEPAFLELLADFTPGVGITEMVEASAIPTDDPDATFPYIETGQGILDMASTAGAKSGEWVYWVHDIAFHGLSPLVGITPDTRNIRG